MGSYPTSNRLEPKLSGKKHQTAAPPTDRFMKTEETEMRTPIQNIRDTEMEREIRGSSLGLSDSANSSIAGGQTHLKMAKSNKHLQKGLVVPSIPKITN